MMDKNIYWNGASSADYGIGVEKHPNSTRPERKIDVYSVPGRNGDIIMSQNAWENVTQSYEIFLTHGEAFRDLTFQQSANYLADWLFSPSGYCKLSDDWEPDVFRMAYVKGPVDLENLFSVSGRATVEFICKPQRYLNAGQTEIAIDTATVNTVENPTIYPASPIITVPVQSGVTFPLTMTIGAYVLTITAASAVTIIDCEEQDCRGTAGSNMNPYVQLTSGEFPKLAPGMNTVTLIDAANTPLSFSIVPNYWRL